MEAFVGAGLTSLVVLAGAAFLWWRSARRSEPEQRLADRFTARAMAEVCAAWILIALVHDGVVSVVS
jgi:hypothetical protein